MTVDEIELKRDNSKRKIENKRSLINKKKSVVEKKVNHLKNAYGIDYKEGMDISPYMGGASWYDIIYTYCDIERYMCDIRRLLLDIENTNKAIKKYNDRINTKMCVQEMSDKLPECIISIKECLTALWDEYDSTKKESLMDELSDLGEEDFIAKYDEDTYSIVSKQFDEISYDNLKRAEDTAIDIYMRVVDVVGNISGWDVTNCKGATVTAIVTGELGKAKLDTVVAGGYNVQRPHIRASITRVSTGEEV